MKRYQWIILAALSTLLIVLCCVLAFRSCSKKEPEKETPEETEQIVNDKVIRVLENESGTANDEQYMMIINGVCVTDYKSFNKGTFAEIRQQDYESYTDKMATDLSDVDNSISGLYVYYRSLDERNVMMIQVIDFKTEAVAKDVYKGIADRQTLLAGEYAKYEDKCKYYSDVKDTNAVFACEIEEPLLVLNQYLQTVIDGNRVITFTVVTDSEGETLTQSMAEICAALDLENPSIYI